MTVVKTIIESGVCGFVADVSATGDDEQCVTLRIATECDNIRAVAAALSDPIDAYTELASGYEGAIWRAARANIPRGCSGCVVPSDLFKSMQVAADLALPADAAVRIAK